MQVLQQKSSSKFQAIAYDDYAGYPLMVTFLRDCWWVTTPGEPLQTREEYNMGEDIMYHFLCEAGGTVGALALAKMLGKALQNPEDVVDEVLRQRVVSLKRLGVTLNVKDESLPLELEIFSNKRGSERVGNYSMRCQLAGNYCEQLFDIDAFSRKEEAKQWALWFFEVLTELGIKYTILIIDNSYDNKQ